MKRNLVLIFSSLACASLNAVFEVDLSIAQKIAHARLQRLSPEQRIGQLFMAAVPCNPEKVSHVDRLNTLKLPANLTKNRTAYLIRRYGIGGILYIGEGEMPNQARATNYFQDICARYNQEPIWLGADYEPGLVRLYDAIKFPRQLTCGATRDPESIYKLGRYLGEQAKRLGVHIIFAPVLDVNNNPNNPVIADRSFGEDPHLVTELGLKLLKGISDVGVIGCVKHAPGHGDTETDSHFALPIIRHTEHQLAEVDLVPFIEAIQHNLHALMTAHIIAPALDKELPSTLSRKTLDFFKNELGFKGLLVTDALNMKALSQFGDQDDLALKALQAGNHILLFPSDIGRSIERVKKALTRGEIAESELNDRVLKVLTYKAALGLYKDTNFVFQNEIVKSVAHPSAAALKAMLYLQALTLVKNQDRIVPLQYHSEGKEGYQKAVVQIGGPIPSLKSRQLSTFTQMLQEDGDVTSFYVEPKSSEEENTLQLKALEEVLADYETVIVGLMGMNKFVDQNFGISPSTLTFLHALKNANKKIILTIFGSPYSLKLFGNEDAIFVAYEDDPDAHRAAALGILGREHPRGKLPVTANEQFPYGIGLTYE